MIYSELVALCQKLGKKDLTAGEEWKTIKYVHTPGQGAPSIDVEQLLIDSKVDLINDANVVGFLAVEPMSSDIIMPVNEKNVDVYTFFDLAHITDLSFQTDEDLIDIYDIVNRFDSSVGYPINITFRTEPDTKYDEDGNPIYEYDNVDDILLQYVISRPIEINTDYTLTFENLDSGVTIDKITEPGKYKVTVSGIGNYHGSASCIIIVNKTIK